MEYSAPLSLDRNIHAILTQPVCLSAIQVHKNILPKKKEIGCHIYIYTMKLHGIQKKSYPRRIKTKRYKCRSPRILCTKKHGIIITEKAKNRSKREGKKGMCTYYTKAVFSVKKRNQKKHTNGKNKNAVSARLPLYMYSFHSMLSAIAFSLELSLVAIK